MASYLLHALLTHPDALARVRAELDAAAELSWPRLRAMPALQGAAMETLRLWPLAIGHDCEATAAFSFAGHDVEAGRRVFVAMAVPHFLPGLYPEPERFDPGRFARRRRGAYAPFGLGDRACLGAGIAQAQLTTICGLALSRFVLELDPPGPPLPPYAASPNAVMHTLGVRVVRAR
jgi:cytochrome P450